MIAAEDEFVLSLFVSGLNGSGPNRVGTWLRYLTPRLTPRLTPNRAGCALTSREARLLLA